MKAVTSWGRKIEDRIRTFAQAARKTRACKAHAESSPVLIPTALTPQKPQKNHPGKQSWPNLFLGRWLKGYPVVAPSCQRVTNVRVGIIHGNQRDRNSAGAIWSRIDFRCGILVKSGCGLNDI
jgi:hypothetical protein